MFFLFFLCHFVLAFRCVQILAAEHRYKLLITEKKGNKRKTTEQEGEEEKNGDTEKTEKPKKNPKAKAKASTKKG